MRAEVTWAEAATLPLCLLTGDMQNRRIVDGIFHEAGAEPKPTLETNSISTLIAHVRDGPWSSVLSHAWLHAFEVPRGMVVIPLVAPATTRTIGLVWLDRDPEPILARALLEVAAGVDLGEELSRTGPGEEAEASPQPVPLLIRSGRV